MEKKNIIITGVVVAVVAVVVGIAVFSNKGGTNAPTLFGGAGGGTASSTGPVTRTAAPANVAVPGVGAASSTPGNVAVPTSVAPANPSDSASARSFSLTVDKDAFSPNEIIVNKGDTVTVSFTAIDKNYDFTLPDYGMKVALPMGTTRQIQLSPSAVGTFLFYCTSCGGPTSGPTGHLVVVAPK